jgi:hypothetical protein
MTMDVPIMEIALVSSTAWLAYVTQLPYAVRRRLHRKARDHVVRVYVLARHHGRLILWQITFILPGRQRTVHLPWHRRDGEEQ